MPTPMTAPKILDREFLEIRAKILELAASFDRLDRGADSVDNDPRVPLIREGLQVLLSGNSDKAEEIQLLFSRIFDEEWRSQFGI